MNRIPKTRRAAHAVAAVAFSFVSSASAFAADPPPGPDGRAPDIGAFTHDLIEQMGVNEPRKPVRPVRDRPLALTSGNADDLQLTVGASRTVTLPGAFDKAIVVIPEVADVIVINKNTAQIMAHKAGSSDVVFSAPDGSVFKVKVSVGANVVALQRALDAVLKNDRITALALNDSVYLGGITRDATVAATAMAVTARFVDDPKNIVNQIRLLGGQQVALYVKVAEVRRNVVKKLGLNSSVTNPVTGFTVGNATGLAAFGSASALTALANTAAGANPIAFASSKIGGVTLNTVLDALETEGLVRTLAEPNLTAISGKTANMLAGGEYPVPSVGQSGQLGTEYRKFGVSLGFTPTVLSPTSIGLDIKTEVSDIGSLVSFPVSGGIGGGTTTVAVPQFTTRSADTSIELPSGGSIVIAGMLQSSFQNTLSGIPGLMDIPILGKLFSSTDYQHNETELVVIVTAVLVSPTDPGKIALPTDAIRPPTDGEMYLFNRLSGKYGSRGPAPSGAGRAFGYITE